MAKRKRRKPRRRESRAPSLYMQNVHQADQVLAQNGAEIRDDNWQEVALDWFVPQEPERTMLACYIAEHEDKLGVAWARELLRGWSCQPLEDDRTLLDVIVAERDELLARREQAMKSR